MNNGQRNTIGKDLHEDGRNDTVVRSGRAPQLDRRMPWNLERRRPQARNSKPFVKLMLDRASDTVRNRVSHTMDGRDRESSLLGRRDRLVKKIREQRFGSCYKSLILPPHLSCCSLQWQFLWAIVLTSASSLGSPSVAAQSEIRPVEPNSGSLSADDPRMPRGSYFDEWVFEIADSGMVIIEMTSEEIDSYLVLSRGLRGSTVEIASDDDGGPGLTLNSWLQVALLPGSYTVTATSADPEETGDYVLSLRFPTELRADGAGVGELTPSDAQLSLDGTPYDTWIYNALEGDSMVVEMTSSDFDPFLVVLRNGTPIASDDDGGGGLDARVAFRAPVVGSYTILANAVSTEAAGSYGITVTVQHGDGSVESSTPSTLRPVEPNSGSLSADDPRMPRGSYFDEWVFEIADSGMVIIEMTSEEIDSYLVLSRGLRGSTVEIASDDDGGPGLTLNSWLQVALLPGSYTVTATSADPEETGDYVLSLRFPTELRADGAGVGELTPSDAQLSLDGTPYDTWIYNALEGDSIVVEMTSSDFDPFLVVLRNGTPIASDDDGGGGLDARVAFRAPEAGSYTVLANSASTEAIGSYRIIVRRASSRHPLHEAAQEGNLASLRSLLKTDVSVDATNADGDTPLHIAFRAGHLNMVQALVEAGASLRFENGNGEGPLTGNDSLSASLRARFRCTTVPMWTSEAFFKQATSTSVKICTELGFDSREEDLSGRIPLHHAMKVSDEDVILTLLRLDGGASKAEDNNGCRPYHVRPEREETVISALVIHGQGATDETKVRKEIRRNLCSDMMSWWARFWKWFVDHLFAALLIAAMVGVVSHLVNRRRAT